MHGPVALAKPSVLISIRNSINQLHLSNGEHEAIQWPQNKLKVTKVHSQSGVHLRHRIYNISVFLCTLVWWEAYVSMFSSVAVTRRYASLYPYFHKIVVFEFLDSDLGKFCSYHIKCILQGITVMLHGEESIELGSIKHNLGKKREMTEWCVLGGRGGENKGFSRPRHLQG